MEERRYKASAMVRATLHDSALGDASSSGISRKRADIQRQVPFEFKGYVELSAISFDVSCLVELHVELDDFGHAKIAERMYFGSIGAGFRGLPEVLRCRGSEVASGKHKNAKLMKAIGRRWTERILLQVGARAISQTVRFARPSTL